jgi:hypothetical protein
MPFPLILTPLPTLIKVSNKASASRSWLMISGCPADLPNNLQREVPIVSSRFLNVLHLIQLRHAI